MENSQREALHPLDQFRAFQTLRAKGLGEEEIAARFSMIASAGAAREAPTPGSTDPAAMHNRRPEWVRKRHAQALAADRGPRP